MSKGKNLTLYVVYAVKTLEDGTKETYRTKVAFKEEDQAQRYCKYLNRGDETKYTFIVHKEPTVVFSKALDIINNPNEDSILYD